MKTFTDITLVSTVISPYVFFSCKTSETRRLVGNLGRKHLGKYRNTSFCSPFKHDKQAHDMESGGNAHWDSI